MTPTTADMLNEAHAKIMNLAIFNEPNPAVCDRLYDIAERIDGLLDDYED